eukprot:m.141985 g.141985  ORF g.141985 m.141985 type:complete len:157 (-) comp24167_c0_seq20:204-674(-)
MPRMFDIVLFLLTFTFSFFVVSLLLYVSSKDRNGSSDSIILDLKRKLHKAYQEIDDVRNDRDAIMKTIAKLETTNRRQEDELQRLQVQLMDERGTRDKSRMRAQQKIKDLEVRLASMTAVQARQQKRQKEQRAEKLWDRLEKMQRRGSGQQQTLQW